MGSHLGSKWAPIWALNGSPFGLQLGAYFFSIDKVSDLSQCLKSSVFVAELFEIKFETIT